MHSVRAMGLNSVAIYSAADAGAPHVELADRAVCIGAGPARESYLNIERVLDSAGASGADGVHPGYGFLAENSAFAAACDAAGLVFVGPSVHAISTMANKATAKQLMREAEVPCVPGYDGRDQSDSMILAAATDIGYPVMVKAAAGGGGRGMRRVEHAAELIAAVRLARTEAMNTFGSDQLILEKAISNARHVEIQIVADNAGHTVHLGERDCSVQRRHQKLIEEAPCPALTADLREQMGAAAIRAARAVGYSGVGTVEFLLDHGGAFYFLEMNTRLQVEHPVTEMVTGLDLVELQIRIARGEALGFTQQEIAMTGHAIEARLYTEDPMHDFMPATGTITRWQPGEGNGIRIDAGIREGQQITPFYDALAAKIIAHGSTREIARRRLSQALQDTALFGPCSNRAFLIQCLESPRLIRGEATTAFIDELFAETDACGTSDPTAAAITAALFYRLDRDAAFAGGPGVSLTLRDWFSGIRLSSRFALEIDGAGHTLRVLPLAQDKYAVSAGGKSTDIEINALDDDAAIVTVDAQRVRIRFQLHGTDELSLALPDQDCRAVRHRAGCSAIADSDSDGSITAAMHGVVQQVLVASGDTVVRGQALLVLEAMKMQQEISAPVSGTVTTVQARAGQQVAGGDPLLTIREHTESGARESP